MGEILGVLTGKARTEAEEAQRAVIHALNGLAGLVLLEVRGVQGQGGGTEDYRSSGESSFF